MTPAYSNSIVSELSKYVDKEVIVYMAGGYNPYQGTLVFVSPIFFVMTTRNSSQQYFMFSQLAGFYALSTSIIKKE